MTLFRKVFTPQETTAKNHPPRTSYDLAMAPEPKDLIEMDALADIFYSEPEPEQNPIVTPDVSDPPSPSMDAVNEAQSLLNSAQVAPTPALNKPSGRRAKTRLLGFNPSADEALDPIRGAEAAEATPRQTHPVGWLVVTEGAGRGEHFALFSGVSSIGRGEDQVISLDFGDMAISRENHAAFAYDPELSKFYLGHGGKSNIMRLNGQPVLSTEELSHGDQIRIGETSLRLVTLCDESFSWSASNV